MKLKKLRKVYRIFFPKRFTANEFFENKLKSNREVAFYEKKEQSYEVTLTNKIKLKIRNENFSDYLVFEQIFNCQEYEIVLGLIKLNQSAHKQKIIIDAGANVGYTTVFFAHYLQFSKIYAIEPSSENANMCRENFSYLNENENIQLYQKALSHKTGMTFSINRDFRDGKDWSITTNFHKDGVIQGVTINEIIQENKLPYVSFLKIDIEGAERFIFKKENDLEFLKITQIIAIEIHDEFNIRNSIIEILIKNNFLILESGELTIGVNKSFI